MLARALPDLAEADLLLLVTNSVAEGRDLEYKRDWPGNSDDDRKEFLADVSSLANAQGGDLVFGVEDADGIATAIPGVDPTNQDAAILRLENILRDGIEPRLSVRVHWILLSNGRGALVIRVPGSLAAPHRVIFKNSGRFFNRNSRGSA
jgi:predicted HTH transcriptional regulator